VANNKIQFSKEMNLEKFISKYGSEDQCREALFNLKWPEGFICSECGSASYYELKNRQVYQCNPCHHQTTLTSGSIFHSSKVSLCKWFLSLYLIIQSTYDITSLELSREIEVSQNTSRSMKYKLMKVILKSGNEGTIELDYVDLEGKQASRYKRNLPSKRVINE